MSNPQVARFLTAFGAVHYLATGKARGFWSYRDEVTATGQVKADDIFEHFEALGIGDAILRASRALTDKAAAGNLKAHGRPNFKRRDGVLVEIDKTRAFDYRDTELDVHEPIPPGAWLSGQLDLSANELKLKRGYAPGQHKIWMTLYSELRFDREELIALRAPGGADEPASLPWTPLPGCAPKQWAAPDGTAEQEAIRRLTEAGRPEPSERALVRELSSMWNAAGMPQLQADSFRRYRAEMR